MAYICQLNFLHDFKEKEIDKYKQAKKHDLSEFYITMNCEPVDRL